MEDYSKQRNKPSTQRGYQGVIDRCIIPIMGRMKVQDVKRPDVAALMKKLAYQPTEANKSFGVLRKMFNLAEVWGLRPGGTHPCRPAIGRASCREGECQYVLIQVVAVYLKKQTKTQLLPTHKIK